MKVYVVFDFPDIEDPDGEEATLTFHSLSDDLKNFCNDNSYDWYIDDVIGEIK